MEKNHVAQILKVVILDCFSGISGDMTIGAFLDLGMDFAYLKAELKKLPLSGYTLAKKSVIKKGIQATKFSVHIKAHDDHDHGHHHSHHHHGEHQEHGTTFTDIKKMISGSSLSARVKELSLAIFTELAKAEASVHGTTVGKVHFHEVGAIDSIVDIVGVAICLDYFKVEKVYARNIHLGTGFLHGKSHGSIPIPAPATIKLLEGYRVELGSLKHELVTPTGASFIRALTLPGEEVPSLRLGTVGYGAGDASFENQANVLRMIFAEPQEASVSDSIVQIEANIDDMQPLFFEPVMERLFEAGALDVFIVPILMKKNRPAQTLKVLAPKKKRDVLTDIIFQHTSTIGVRFFNVERAVLARECASVKTVYGTVDIKVSTLPDGTQKVYPEYESCKRVARKKNVSVESVYRAASMLYKGSEKNDEKK